MNAVLCLSLLFTALAMSTGLAHAFELWNKIKLSAEEYRVVQQIYRGWALLGTVVLGSLISTLVLTVLSRGRSKIFPLSLAAFLCMAATQLIFWTLTYPVNQQTVNWTVLPPAWLGLRTRWEYSHAASAALELVAFILLLVANSRRA